MLTYRKKFLLYSLTILLVISLIGFFVYRFFFISSSSLLNKLPSQVNHQSFSSLPSPSPSSSSTPPPNSHVLPLPSGPQTYTISSSVKNSPLITKAIVDPLDVKKGQLQKFSVTISDPQEVTLVKANLITDNQEKEHLLKLTQGNNKNGVWQGSWYIEDSFLNNYQITIKAQNKKGLSSTVTLTFR